MKRNLRAGLRLTPARCCRRGPFSVRASANGPAGPHRGGCTVLTPVWSVSGCGRDLARRGLTSGRMGPVEGLGSLCTQTVLADVGPNAIFEIRVATVGLRERARRPPTAAASEAQPSTHDVLDARPPGRGARLETHLPTASVDGRRSVAWLVANGHRRVPRSSLPTTFSAVDRLQMQASLPHCRC